MQRGFTLIETLIALAIAAIVSSLALPNYSAYIARAHRFEAALHLQQMMLKQEQLRWDRNSYASRIEELRPAQSARFRYSVEDADARGYTLLARAIGAQAHDPACPVLRLRVQGGDVQYQHEGSAAPGRCWAR